MYNELSNRDSCTIYIPLTVEEKEPFLVELLDLCEAYLEPMKYGVHREDICEYIELHSDIPFIDFLRSKKYIAVASDFIDLAVKYSQFNAANTTKCLMLVFSEVEYDDVEKFFGENTIDEIMSKHSNNDNVVIRTGMLSKEGAFLYG